MTSLIPVVLFAFRRVEIPEAQTPIVSLTMDSGMALGLTVGEGKKRMSWMARSVSKFSSKHDKKHKEQEVASRKKPPGAANANLIKPTAGSTQAGADGNNKEATESLPLLKGREPDTFFSLYMQPSCVELIGVAMYVFVGGLVSQTETSSLTNGVVHGLAITLLGFSFSKIR
ncbi:hypothetical protein LSAT2_025183 [Lamellibrachia satsuma]|nr:hypothetical protein LSAT2_025183 [Lamellibrachia satsuma]